jgi:hypothetical protein
MAKLTTEGMWEKMLTGDRASSVCGESGGCCRRRHAASSATPLFAGLAAY